MRNYVALLLLISTLGVGVADVRADQVTVPLEERNEPAELQVSLVNGSVHLIAAEIDHVLIDLRGGDDDDDDAVPHGMQRVSKALRALKLDQHGNRVEISLNPSSSAVLTLTVPTASTAKLSTVNGRIEVQGITGELELHNTNGRIEAREVSGPVSASTVNGKVDVELSDTPARTEMAFSTLNGDVDVTLPDGYGADLTLSSDNGAIYSDFEVVVTGDLPKTRRVVGQKMSGKINGGGPALLLKTFNGDIVLHKKKR
jgi:hypothetical protein